MQTMASAIFPDSYQIVRTLFEYLADGRQAQAKMELKRLIPQLQEHSNPAEALQVQFFINALQHRLSTEALALDNLYMLPDQGKQIELFHFMAQKFPIVRFAQDLINRHYVQALQSSPHLALWDIGIGTGQQIIRLLQDLLATGLTLQTVTVIGLDPSAASVQTAFENIQALCQAHSIALTYIPIVCTVEALTDVHWQEIETALRPSSGSWIANASFALHHICPPGVRTPFFQRVKALNPRQFGVIEPYSDLIEPNLLQRFENTWHHYGLTFHSIDQITEASIELRNQLKSIFFGREILEILGQDENRIEQYETGEMWAHRFQMAGFATLPFEQTPLAIPNFPHVQPVQNKDYLAFTVQSFPLVSLLLLQPI